MHSPPTTAVVKCLWPLAVCLASRLSVDERVSAWQILEEDMNFVCVDTWLVMVTGG